MKQRSSDSSHNQYKIIIVKQSIVDRDADELSYKKWSPVMDTEEEIDYSDGFMTLEEAIEIIELLGKYKLFQIVPISLGNRLMIVFIQK